MRLIADENFPLESIRRLRTKGYDVLSVSESMSGSADTEVLACAVKETRVLVTFDRDFGALVFRQEAAPPPAIILLRFVPSSPVEAAAILITLFEQTDLAVTDHFTVLNRDRIRQRRLPGSG